MSSLALDRLGGIASSTCALHCITLSIAPAVVALIDLEFLRSEALEWGFFASAMLLGLLASALSFRAHQNTRILAGFGIGLGLLLAGRLGEAFHLFPGAGVVAIVGGLTLAGAHLQSLRHTRQCAADCA